MITIRYNCGFWFFDRDGREIGNTGDDQVRAAERKTGLKVNHRTVTDLDVIAAAIGPDAVSVVETYKASLPKPKPLTARQKQAQYRRELKGF